MAIKDIISFGFGPSDNNFIPTFGFGGMVDEAKWCVDEIGVFSPIIIGVFVSHAEAQGVICE